MRLLPSSTIVSPGFFFDACLEVMGGWFLRYLEFLDRFVEFFGHFVEFFGKFTEFLATLLELLIFLYLFSPEPLILLTFSTFPWEKGEFFNTKRWKVLRLVEFSSEIFQKSSGSLSFSQKLGLSFSQTWVFSAWVFFKMSKKKPGLPWYL